MAECPTLETDRLRLRPFVDDDVEATSRSTTRPRSAGHCTSPTRSPRRRLDPPCPLARPMALRGTGQWALERRDTGAFIGRAGSHLPNEPVGRVWRSAGHSIPTTGATVTPPRPGGPRSTGVSEPRRRRTRERDPAREHGEPGRGSPRLRVVRGADPAALSPATPRDLAACEAGDGRRPLSLRPVGDFARC